MAGHDVTPAADFVHVLYVSITAGVYKTHAIKVVEQAKVIESPQHDLDIAQRQGDAVQQTPDRRSRRAKSRRRLFELPVGPPWSGGGHCGWEPRASFAYASVLKKSSSTNGFRPVRCRTNERPAPSQPYQRTRWPCAPGRFQRGKYQHVRKR